MTTILNWMRCDILALYVKFWCYDSRFIVIFVFQQLVAACDVASMMWSDKWETTFLLQRRKFETCWLTIRCAIKTIASLKLDQLPGTVKNPLVLSVIEQNCDSADSNNVKCCLLSLRFFRGCLWCTILIHARSQMWFSGFCSTSLRAMFTGTFRSI